MDGIDDKREDNLVGTLVIVGIEQFAVILLKGKAGTDDFLASGNTVCVVRTGTIHLGVEIQLRQQCPGGGL